MTPLSEAVLELRLVASKAEQDLADLGPEPASHAIEDHRVRVSAELFDALDRADRSLGTRLMLAMYPQANAWRDIQRGGPR